MTTRWFRIDLNPVPWAVGPLFTKRVSQTKSVAAMGANSELVNYQNAIKAALKDEGEILQGPLKLTLFFWRQIEEYKTAAGRKARSHEADLTNLQKAVEDALHGIFYTNDKIVSVVDARIIRQDTETEGCIVIGIKELTYTEVSIGIDSMIPQEILHPKEEHDENDDRKRYLDSEPDF
jgi:Holliday junction resolvase RusA-like endonuclease